MTDERPVEQARAELQAAVPEAANVLRDLLGSDDDTTRLRAAEAVLDRAGITRAERTDTRAAQRDVGGQPLPDPIAELLDERG